MIRFFSTIHPINIVVIFLLGILLRIPFFSEPVVPALNESSGIFYHFLYAHVILPLSDHAWLYPLISYLIIFIQSLSLNGFLNEQKVYGSAHLLYTLVCVLFSVLIPEWNTLSSVLIVNLIFSIILPRFIFLYQKTQVQNELFFLSFLGGVSSLIFKPAILALLILFILLIVFRSFKLTEWMVTLVGFCLPYYLTSVFLYVSDSWQELVLLKPLMSFFKPDLFNTPDDWIAVILIIAPCLPGCFYVWKYTARFLVLQRKVWGFAFFYILFSLIFFVYVPAGSTEAMFLFFFPASFFITAFLYFPSVKFFPSLYIWLVLSFFVVRFFYTF